MESPLDAQIANFKTLVWQNQAIAQRYQVNIYQDSFVISLKNVREVVLAIEHAKGKVLDAGAGTGRFTIPLHDAGFDVTGLDVSAEMLGVARQAAGSRPIPLIQGSVFDLPFDQNSFDSVVSITVVPHFPQWKDVLREYVRVLRPGGRLMFNMCSLQNVSLANRNGLRHGAMGHPGDPNYYQAEVEAEEVIATLASLGVTVTHVLPYDTFNHNYLLRETLGTANESAMAELEQIFREPGAIELWDYIEAKLFPHLPLTTSYGYMVVAELPGPDAQLTPWQPPRALIPRDGVIDTEALRAVMGSAMDEFLSGLLARLKPFGAIRLLAALDDLIGSRLPISFDFLSLLDNFNRARVLDQIAWRWAQGWHTTPHSAAFNEHGISLAPLLNYEVLNNFTKALKPLVEGIE